MIKKNDLRSHLHCETMLQGVRKISRQDRSGLFRREIISYFILEFGDFPLTLIDWEKGANIRHSRFVRKSLFNCQESKACY